MSSVIKHHNLIVENQDPYIVGNTVKVYDEEGNVSTQTIERREESLMTKLEELSEKINDAEKRYKDIVDESEKIIFETNNKAEKILSEAKKDGQDQGYIDGKKIADEESAQYKAQLDLEFQKNLELMQKEKQDFLIHTKNQLGEIFKTAFIKVFENEIAHSNTLLQILIMKGLRELSDEKEIRVILSENDYKIFDKEAFKVALGDLYSDKIITFAQDKNAQNGTCILETSLGYIDASLNHLARYVTMLIDDSIVESNEEGDDDASNQIVSNEPNNIEY